MHRRPMFDNFFLPIIGKMTANYEIHSDFALQHVNNVCKQLTSHLFLM